jgi:hypothetical protein
MPSHTCKRRSRRSVFVVLVFLHTPIVAGIVAALTAPFFDDHRSGIAVRLGVFLFGLLGLFVYPAILRSSWSYWKSIRAGNNDMPEDGDSTRDANENNLNADSDGATHYWILH